MNYKSKMVLLFCDCYDVKYVTSTLQIEICMAIDYAHNFPVTEIC